MEPETASQETAKAFCFWAAVNVLLPIGVTVTPLPDFIPIELRMVEGLVLIFLVLAANIYAIVKFRALRSLFVITILLNLFAAVLLGDLTFVTAIPNIPFLIKSQYMLLMQQ